MAVNPMLASGMNGIQQGMQGFDRAAQEIAEFNLESPSEGKRLDNAADVAEAIVDLTLYQRQVQASAKVVQTADETMGFLLGISK
ncbi:MAG: flagellar biosynthesis protein FlgE [Pseudomonadales bacterium]|nr:flagellar biosynthesis protein FlgE [Pseudomonadales bacterium]